MTRSLRRLSTLSLAASIAALAVPARASEPPPWEAWPWGRTFESPVARPPDGVVRVCSFDWPICAHGDSPAATLGALATAEAAMSAFSSRSRLPTPMPDARGGSPAFDLYLAKTDGAPLRVGFEAPTSTPVDRAAAFAIVDARLPEGCARRTAIARGVAMAMLAAVDGGADAGSFGVTSSYLAASATGCWTAALQAVDDAQEHPERALVRGADFDDASIVLPLYLEGGFGAGPPGTLLSALWYGGRQTTPPEATRFHNQPDLWETIRRVGRAKEKRLDEVMLDIAIARAFYGDREDGQHVAESAFAGAFGRVRFDAAWPFRTLPRRVAFTPLEPTGSTYVWIDLAGAPSDLSLAIHAEWESPVTMRWAVVRVGENGEETSRIEITTERGIRVVERSVLGLGGLAGLVVVGVNIGDLGINEPFRLDEAPYEPHGGTLYVVRE